jgi:nicotinamide mononucleotide adenylyltransferase
MEKSFNGKGTAAIFLAHLNPLTISHEKIIQSLLENYKVYIFPVRFLKNNREINTRSFPFSFEIRKQMIQESFDYDKDITVLSNYTFTSPYIRYFRPIISPPFQKLKKNIISGIQESKFITYTGDRAERLLLKLFGFNPIQANRQVISSTNVKNLLYKSAISFKMLSRSNNIDWEWNSYVSPNVSNIIRNNWNVIEHFSNSADKTIRVFGMKFPKDGFV